MLLALLFAPAPLPAAAQEEGKNQESEASVRTLLMPGKLTSAHADLEAHCEKCHAAFAKAAQDELCLACHKEQAGDIASGNGFHGRQAHAGGECRRCHTEHKGREADISSLDRDRFDHALTDYPLQGAHQRIGCTSCHRSERPWREAPHECVGCHREDDRHAGNLGESCGDCHEPLQWRRTRFDHDTTQFALRGRHAEVSCAACHPGERYRSTPPRCNACHALGDVHRGRRGDNCERCHVVEGRDRIRFDHAKETRFALGGAHARVRCTACHTRPRFEQVAGSACADCHGSDDVHGGRNGRRCGDCHDQQQWKKARFDHARDAGFELLGAHAELACMACHTAEARKGSTPRQCVGCHEADDVHRGVQSENCGRCHEQRSWSESVAFDHDLGRFPLLGMHAALPCESCHVDQAFAVTQTRCNSCHAQADKHAGSLGDDCGACHNPAGWQFWRFDHDRTAFPLDGGHRELACNDCHAEPAGTMRLARDCYGCHAQDDRHDGEFGRACERCHVTESFARFRDGRFGGAGQ